MRSNNATCKHVARRDNASPRRGFTLIELVLVIGILAILASLTISRLSGRAAQHRIQAAANRIVNDIRLTQRNARAASATQRIEFDAANHAYRIPNAESLRGDGEAYAVQLADAPYEVELLSADFDGGSTLAFDGHGAPVTVGELVLAAGDVRAVLTINTQGQVDVVESIVTAPAPDRVLVPADEDAKEIETPEIQAPTLAPVDTTPVTADWTPGG